MSVSSARRGVLARLGVVLYPGEGALAGWLFASFVLCVAFQYSAKTFRQASFIDTLGAARLPLAYLLVAVCSLPVAKGYAALSERVSCWRLGLATFVSIVLGLVAFWWLFQYPWGWVPMAFYVWTGIAIALSLSQLWLLASHAFNVRQAKRLYGFLGAGALLGGVLGGMIARFVAQTTEPRHSLLLVAVLLVGVVAALARIRSSFVELSPPSGVAKAGSRDALATIARSRQLSLIAGLLLLVVVVSQIVDLQFSWAVESVTTGLEERTVFFGSFFSVVCVTAFVFQLALTTRIHRRLGIGFALRVLPATLAFGTIILLLGAALLPSLLIAVAVGLKIADNGLRYSLDDSTRELLFLPVSDTDRARVKTFLDVFVKRVSKGLAALLLLPVTLGWITPLQTGWISLALIVVWVALTGRVTHEYVVSIRRGLQRKSVDPGTPIDLSDVATLEILVQSLGSSDPRQVLNGLEILAANDRGYLVPPLLLYHDDADVRLKTLQILAAEGREDAAPLIQRRLSDLDPAVRVEATRVLADLWHRDACETMLPRLESADPGVRAAAIACLTNHGDALGREKAERALADMATDADPVTRVEGAHALGAIAEPVFEHRLVQMLYDPEPRVVRAAIRGIRQRSVRSTPNPIYLPTMISLLANRRLKHDVREALSAYGETAIPALHLFLHDRDEPLWVKRALPKTLASIASHRVLGVLLDALEIRSDLFLRRKILEALSSLDVELDDEASRRRIRLEIRVEASGYLVKLSDLSALDPSVAVEIHDLSGPRPYLVGQPLLEQLLAERAAERLHNLFLVLGMLYDRASMLDAYHALHQRDRAAGALEFLDCTLDSEDKVVVLSALDDAPLAEKLARAEGEFGLQRASRLGTVAKHLAPIDEATEDSHHLAVGALHTVFVEGLSELYPMVRVLRESAADPFVAETAAWVLRRLDTSARVATTRSEG